MPGTGLRAAVVFAEGASVQHRLDRMAGRADCQMTISGTGVLETYLGGLAAGRGRSFGRQALRSAVEPQPCPAFQNFVAKILRRPTG